MLRASYNGSLSDKCALKVVQVVEVAVLLKEVLHLQVTMEIYSVLCSRGL